jgi:hypothetical protein
VVLLIILLVPITTEMSYKFAPYVMRNAGFITSCEKNWLEAILFVQIYTNPREMVIFEKFPGLETRAFFQKIEQIHLKQI